MKIGGQRPRGKAPAGKHWCVRSGWIVDYDRPSPHGVNIDHAIVGTTPGGTLHQVGYKTLGDEAAAQEEPSKRPGRLTAERQRRSKAKRTLASCLVGGGGCVLCKKRRQDQRRSLAAAAAQVRPTARCSPPPVSAARPRVERAPLGEPPAGDSRRPPRPRPR